MAGTTLIYELTEDGEGYIITGYTSIADDGVIVIPNEFKPIFPFNQPSKPVTGIKEKAFSGSTEITSVTISSNVTSIGDEAFQNCSNLATILIPNGVKTIGTNVFRGCSSLTIYCEVGSKPNGWASSWNSSNRTVFWGNAFNGTTAEGLEWEFTSNGMIITGCLNNLKEIKIPKKINGISVILIQEDAFKNETALKKVIFEAPTPQIASNAFNGCNSVEFCYSASILNDSFPYGSRLSTRTFIGMPYQDMDYLGFTFNGKHSYLDLGVLRIINDRMQHSLSPDMNDITADNPGGDGMYYFGSHHKSKKFQIDFAFDHLNEQQMRAWKKFCSNKELSDLIFDEEPYKVYTAKITGAPILKTIPFDEDGERIYKGEGTLEFTAYWPYAHTPDNQTLMSKKIITSGHFPGDGRNFSNYIYGTKELWKDVSGIAVHSDGANPGDMPAPFVYSTTATLNANDTITVGDLTITVLQTTYNLKWDSKTGIVSGTNSDGDETTRKPILYSGESLGGIRVGGTATIPQTGTLTYHYWYY